MKRRALLGAAATGGSVALFSGCTNRLRPPSGSPDRSGTGHPCDRPRNIDYDAVGEYRDHGVYLENSTGAVHTACVTVTEEGREGEEGTASPPPLGHAGYAIHPGRAVGIFTFEEGGRYRVEVRIEETTTREVFEKTAAEFDDGETRITTFEITGPTSIRVAYGGDS